MDIESPFAKCVVRRFSFIQHWLPIITFGQMR